MLGLHCSTWIRILELITRVIKMNLPKNNDIHISRIVIGRMSFDRMTLDRMTLDGMMYGKMSLNGLSLEECHLTE
jgi:hypothetical protein